MKWETEPNDSLHKKQDGQYSKTNCTLFNSIRLFYINHAYWSCKLVYTILPALQSLWEWDKENSIPNLQSAKYGSSHWQEKKRKRSLNCLCGATHTDQENGSRIKAKLPKPGGEGKREGRRRGGEMEEGRREERGEGGGKFLPWGKEKKESRHQRMDARGATTRNSKWLREEEKSDCLLSQESLCRFFFCSCLWPKINRKKSRHTHQKPVLKTS